MQSLKKPLFFRRAAAYLADLLVVYALVVGTLVACIFLYGALKYNGDAVMLKALFNAKSTRAFTFWAHAMLYLSYFTICHWYAGRTLGKWVMGIRVARAENGADLSFGQSLARSLAYLVSGQLTLGIGFLLPVFRRDGKTLHDLLTGTAVSMNEPARAALPAPEASSSDQAAA